MTSVATATAAKERHCCAVAASGISTSPTRTARRTSVCWALDRAFVAPGFRYAEEFTGTNGIGSPLEDRRPFSVRGGEHFRENLLEFACIGAPVVHPIS